MMATGNREIEDWNRWMTEGRSPLDTFHLAMLMAMPPDQERRFRRHLVLEVIPALHRRGEYLTGADFASRLALFVRGGELAPAVGREDI